MPTKCPLYVITEKDNHTTIDIAKHNIHYVIPTDDIYYMDEDHTSCENYAGHFLKEFVNNLPENFL